MGVPIALGLDVPNFTKHVPNFMKDVPNFVKNVPRVKNTSRGGDQPLITSL